MIRPITENDVPALTAIEGNSFKTPLDGDYFRRQLRNPLAVFFVEEIEGRVIAYCGAWHIEDELHFQNMAVLPEFRRLGAGRRLLNYLFEIAASRSVKAVTLEVRVSNAAAIALYEGFGFKILGRRIAYYEDGEDAFLMWKHFRE